MPTASCLCGAVAWTTDGEITFAHHCHCSRCRKAHGSGFATYAGVPADAFRVTRGADAVVRFPSAPDNVRAFCGRCGSVVPAGAPGGLVFVPLGPIEGDPGGRPVAHIFAASRAPWVPIADGLAAFDAYPPGVDAAVLPDRAPLDPPGGIRGSCLCAGVTYVVEGAVTRCLSCHCSRCRRARAAAHASNLFTARDGVRFTRGADRLVTYRLPEAKHFSQVFCRTCGSKMPRLDPERGIAVVPMGGLDDDPGVRPAAHIYVGSKAPWFEIADTLPRYAEAPPAA